MGCTSSKQARHDVLQHEFPRSKSMPSHHSAKRRATVMSDGHHIVSLKSSTLGIIRLESISDDESDDEGTSDTMKRMIKGGGNDAAAALSSEVLKAKIWSDMMERKIPKTPTMTPPHEPETINMWELMAGLEDISPIRRPAGTIERSFSFHAIPPDALWEPADVTDVVEHLKGAKPAADSGKVMNGGSSTSLSPKTVQPRAEYGDEDPDTESISAETERMSLVKARISAFQGRINAKKVRAHKAATVAAAGTTQSRCQIPPPGAEDKVVFYFTSLRGIRKTHEDCCQVQMILRGYSVRVDERDTSMHSGFKEELSEILGPGCQLPRVFANGRYLGGAEEVRRMHESGELSDALKGCEHAPAGGKSGQGVLATCEACGDMRFVPCERCSGSCKVFEEEEEEEEERVVARENAGGGEASGFRRCPDCNENGLVRCPICCPAHR